MITLITCVDANWGIGRNGSLPWNIPEEMEFFKKTTIGNGNNVCVMGSSTYKSIKTKGSILPKRAIRVISSNTIENKNVTSSILSLETIRELEKNFEEVYIIGGASIYTQALNLGIVDKVVISFLPKKYDCDTFFPGHLLFGDDFEHLNYTSFGKFSVLELIKKN